MKRTELGTTQHLALVGCWDRVLRGRGVGGAALASAALLVRGQAASALFRNPSLAMPILRPPPGRLGKYTDMTFTVLTVFERLVQWHRAHPRRCVAITTARPRKVSTSPTETLHPLNSDSPLPPGARLLAPPDLISTCVNSAAPIPHIHGIAQYSFASGSFHFP